MEEFLRLPTAEKVEKWKSMTLEERKSFIVSRMEEIENLHSPLTSKNIEEMIYKIYSIDIYNLRDRDLENSLKIHSISRASWDCFRENTKFDLRHVIKIFNVPFVDLFNCTGPFDHFIKMFEYGCYNSIRFKISTSPETIVEYWGYGFQLQSVIASNYITDEEFLLYLKHFLMINPLNLSYITRVVAKVFDKPFSLNQIVKSRISYFLIEVNFRGILFPDIEYNESVYLCDNDKDKYIDIKDIPLIRHLNHITVLSNGLNVKINDTLIKVLKENDRFPYPRFNKTKYYTYPRDLKVIIFSMLCWHGRFRNIYRISDKNLIYLILDYVVFNYYLDLEEKIKKWNILSEKYKSIRKEVFRERCIDSFIRTDFAPELKALNDISGYNLKSTLANFHDYESKGMTQWKVFNRNYNIRELVNFCYEHNIAMSLIRKGKIKLNKQLEIIDLGEAVRLSKVKREKDKEKGLNLLKSEESMTKRIKLE